MFRELLTQLDAAKLSTGGLILFFIVFVGVLFYALTRTPRQADAWSRIPLTGDKQDKETSFEER